jgi:tRNA G18 (ribose-2'-O)-methylase SpoU
MRGFFGVGVEGISKEANVGNLVRSTHAFGGSFFFAIAPDVDIHQMRTSDTSNAFNHMPYYQYEKTADLALPEGTQLVGVEFVDESIDLPSFRHPLRAAYVLGPEMGSLSPEMVGMCDHVIKIPMKFCINVGVAGAIVLYDRVLSMGEFQERPVKAGGPVNFQGTPEKDLPVTTGHRRRIRQKKI